MSNIIEFLESKKDTFDKAIDYFKVAYEKAGLSPEQISKAIEEL